MPNYQNSSAPAPWLTRMKGVGQHVLTAAGNLNPAAGLLLVGTAAYFIAPVVEAGWQATSGTPTTPAAVTPAPAGNDPATTPGGSTWRTTPTAPGLAFVLPSPGAAATTHTPGITAAQRLRHYTRVLWGAGRWLGSAAKTNVAPVAAQYLHAGAQALHGELSRPAPHTFAQRATPAPSQQRHASMVQPQQPRGFPNARPNAWRATGPAYGRFPAYRPMLRPWSGGGGGFRNFGGFGSRFGRR